jgi:hypothetical protein
MENRIGRFRHGIFRHINRAAWCVRPVFRPRVQWGAHMIRPASVRPSVRRPSSAALAASARRMGLPAVDANRAGPVHDARHADRPAYAAGLRHSSVVDWHAVAARLAARFPAGHDARAEFDGFVDATIVIDAANGASVCIPDPNYRGGLL